MQLAIITTYMNPTGSRRIERNFEIWTGWASRFAPVHCACLDFPWAVAPDPGGVTLHRFRADASHWLWQKERLLNALVGRLPQFDTFAWIDADTILAHCDWTQYLDRVLNRCKVAQLFGRFVRCDELGVPQQTIEGQVKQQYRTGAPGGAFAARRELWTVGGGLYDCDIVGGGDAGALAAWAGNPWIRQDCQREHYQTWAAVAHGWCQGSIGYVPGDAIHLFHGRPANRQYISRYEILMRHQFDAGTMLTIDQGGPWQWTAAAPEAMRHEIREYFQNRRDDG